MTNDETAKELLASSYLLSAQRIREALQLRFTIQNSRKPSMPPTIAGEVVGLCGQSGRHPYFRIPLRVLESALDRIEQAFCSRSSTQLKMEEIAAACEDLRQQTYFDTGTGCANDRLPAMVPLLPPEEIWLDGRELPLDIWRLVSFEFDLVSSSVSSQLSVVDFAFSAVTQSALAFRFLINQLGNRRVRFDVELRRVPNAWTPTRPNPLIMDVSLARIFFEAGSLLTPLAPQDFAKWYGAVRYMYWIDNTSSELRVKDEFSGDSVDCRYRGLFAEETAIGLMAVVLNDLFDARPINNTVEVIPRASLTAGQAIADFIAEATNPLTAMKTTIIAESKGSLGHRISKARSDRAKKQVATTNILFTGSNQTLPLTFGSAIYFQKQSQRTRSIIDDPSSEFRADSIRVEPVDAWRVAYAKALRFVGLETAAQQVLRGAPAEALRPIDFDRQLDRRRTERDSQRLHRAAFARQRFGTELLLDVGPSAVSLESDVMAILRRGIARESTQRLSKILSGRVDFPHHRFRGASFEGSLGLGCVSYEDLDERGPEKRPEI